MLNRFPPDPGPLGVDNAWPPRRPKRKPVMLAPEWCGNQYSGRLVGRRIEANADEFRGVCSAPRPDDSKPWARAAEDHCAQAPWSATAL